MLSSVYQKIMSTGVACQLYMIMARKQILEREYQLNHEKVSQ